MSSFADYEQASRHYDETRVPVGSEIILGCLSRHAKPLDRIALLDAGCGTGAYSRAVAPKVGHIELLDMSAGMLEKARTALGTLASAGRAGFRQGAITELPFADGSFDAVMINQVVHHLGDHADGDFPELRRVIAEVARVLRPGGLFLFNHCSQEQLGRGYWYHALIPEAAAAFARHFAPLDQVEAMMVAAGLRPRGRFVPIDAVCQGELYFDGSGPLRESWRAGDSVWSLAGEAELEAALARVRALRDGGRLEAFVAERDAERPRVGQITMLYAVAES